MEFTKTIFGNQTNKYCSGQNANPTKLKYKKGNKIKDMQNLELKKELQDFQDKHYNNNVIPSFFIFLLPLLVIFVLPNKILDILPFLRKFTNFMSEIFPNIKIYSTNYTHSELCEFYFSLVWIYSFLVMLYCFYKFPTYFDYDEKYYGVGKYKYRGIFQKRFFQVAKYTPKAYCAGFIIFALIFLFIYLNYSGFLIKTYLWRYTGGEVGILFLAGLQIFSIYGFCLIFIDTVSSIINLKRLENLIKEERDVR